MGKILNFYKKNIGPTYTKAIIGSLFTFVIGICVYLFVYHPNEKKEIIQHYDEYVLLFKNENKKNRLVLDRIKINIKVLKNVKSRARFLEKFSVKFLNKNFETDSISHYLIAFAEYKKENLSDQSQVNAIIDDQNDKVDIKLQSYLQTEKNLIDRNFDRLSNRLAFSEEDRNDTEKLFKSFQQFDDFSSIIYPRILDEIKNSNNEVKEERIKNDFKNYEQRYFLLLFLLMILISLILGMIYIGVKLCHFKNE